MDVDKIIEVITQIIAAIMSLKGATDDQIAARIKDPLPRDMLKVRRGLRERGITGRELREAMKKIRDDLACDCCNDELAADLIAEAKDVLAEQRAA